jgi:stage II sporulation protein E
LVRDAENWGYATVDLMCIDLFNGDARFYKYGAAPSYVRTGNVIRKIRCSSYAPGLEYEAGKTPDVMRMKMKPGSVAVIASDGIVSDGKDLWLRKLLQETDGTDMKALAGKVVQSAINEYGRNDDMTALAIKLEVRT